jgi:tetratricopeptide (TPR) repeat protein
LDIEHFWDYENPDLEEQRFRALVPSVEASGNRASLVELLTQVARARGLQGNFEEAHLTLDRAESLLEPEMYCARSRYLLERGRALNSSGHAEESRSYFSSAWEIASGHGETFHAADAAHMLGIVEEPNNQVEWSMRALELAESSDDPGVRRWQGALYNNLGWTYHDLGRFEDALAMFKRGLAWRREQNQPRQARIAAWTVGRGLRSLDRFEEALALQWRNLNEAEIAGDSPGFVEEEIGECLLSLGRLEEARPHFARAHAELSKVDWIADDDPERLTRLETLSVLS